MDVILGIDIGGSTTKIVGLRTDGSVISMLRVRAEDQVTSLYGALGNYLTSNRLSLRDVVVSMGTGTAFLWASPDGIRHLCGSGIGGGTLGGLCHKLVGMERFGQIKKLAESGNLDHVDLTMKDITVHSAPTLDPDMTAANFGDLAEDATPADLAAGVVNLVLQAIGTMTVLACQCCDSKTVVLTGSMTTLPQAVTNFQLFEKLYGIHYIIPENATFATAIGAGLYSLQKKPEA